VNPSRDLITFNASPFVKNFTGNIGYRINPYSNLDLSYTWSENEDRMEPRRFYFQQQFTRLAYNINARKLKLFYEGRLGGAKNFLVLDDPSIVKQNISNTLNSEVHVLPWAWAGIFLQHQRTSRFSSQNQLTDYFFYGGSLRLPINKKINANFNYRSNYALDELTETLSFMSASVNFNLKKHSLELLGGKIFMPSINTSVFDDLYFVLKYNYNLNAPISRLKNLGNIQGQIAVSSEGLKREGIVITLGDKKFTSDKDGKFYFKHLVADKYYLDIDKVSLPKGVITNLKLPFEIDLKGDSTKLINLSLTKTGTIIGKILFGNIENDEGKGKPSVLITVSNDTEKLYTRVNKNDEFSCKQVKPGKWSVTASIIGGNPEDYTITDASQSIELGVDDRMEVDFTIENYKRIIEFNPSTFNLIEKKDNKEISVTKQNDIPKENSIIKEDNVPKENSVTKENSIIKEDNVPKENNVTKENSNIKKDNVSQENSDSWSNKTSPVNKTKPKTIPKTKSIVKDVKQTKNATKSTNKNKTKNQSLKKKQNYTIISI
jgi:hypothetical protein